ncbi:hypothetical protein Taro_035502 [Colocasia esculenta]|uniref:Uncharacterized protein n=1 Tax=Colocasia esculenta TaxID=4460 RepID=A0A843WAP4_COLES|nr:hypothetical protein [Colocasia esculenta]
MNSTASGLDVNLLAVQLAARDVDVYCLVSEPGVILEREWLSRRLVRRLETPRHLSRRNLCHRTHTVVLFRRHLLLRQLRD